VIGEDVFVAGVRRYLQQHDGTAATVEDLLAALEQVSGRELDGFRRWYSQSGTPQVEIRDEYDAAARRYRLHLRQHTPPTQDQPQKVALPIPLRFSLRDEGDRLLAIPPQPPLLPRPDLLLLESDEAELVLENIASPPTPAFLHGFSAPVKLRYAYAPDALSRVVLYEEDGFLRWEAMQRLIADALFENMSSTRTGTHMQVLLRTLQVLAANPPTDKALLAELLRLPAESELAATIEPLDAQRVVRARDGLRHAIAIALTGPLSVWAEWAPTELSAENRARRSLSNLALWYLGDLGSARIRRLAQERSASPNMTLAMGGLSALRDTDSDEREHAMSAFHARFRSDPLVLDKWFALEAGSARGNGVERVRSLLAHPVFQMNPNRVRAVLGTFMRENLRGFHSEDGSGYRLLSERIAHLDSGNPQLAARLVEGLLGWRRLVPALGEKMRAALEDVARTRPSRDVAEKVNKALEASAATS
jgi:aminopeptidase N